MVVRLQKYLADAGICSRRKAEILILEGKVKVNDKVVTELGTKVDSEKDSIYFEDKKIDISNKNVYIILNKPKEYVTTVKDQFGRATVMDLIKDIECRLVPVGRLDYNTSGLIIMTNDGELVYKITHPKHNINKVYIAQIKGIPTSQEIFDFENGLYIEDYKTSDAKFEFMQTKNNISTVKITIHEGKNRQIRKMCDKIGHPVIELTRISIGDIQLEQLATGQYRYLTDKEIDYLKKI
jgi:23S rRNA pseudouridine2605 synthase